MNQPEKTCTTCGNFVQHYRKNRSRFVPVCCGTCTKRTLTARERRNLSLVGCAEWIPMEEQLKARRSDIDKTLQTIAENLDHIAKILLDDEEIKKNLRR